MNFCLLSISFRETFFSCCILTRHHYWFTLLCGCKQSGLWICACVMLLVVDKIYINQSTDKKHAYRCAVSQDSKKISRIASVLKVETMLFSFFGLPTVTFNYACQVLPFKGIFRHITLQMYHITKQSYWMSFLFQNSLSYFCLMVWPNKSLSHYQIILVRAICFHLYFVWNVYFCLTFWQLTLYSKESHEIKDDVASKKILKKKNNFKYFMFSVAESM